ncbi:MAG: hypothetical protein JNN05_05965 [Candidatus Omnitrophica bacterium]|nr:hypothetical protein [Candidatus Omnitrophota bacterium]
MKNKIIAGTVMSLLLIVSGAQANRMMNVDEKVKDMQRELSLTDNQANEVRPILQDFKDKMENLKQDKESKLSKVLSDEQMTKFRDMKDDKDKY